METGSSTNSLLYYSVLRGVTTDATENAPAEEQNTLAGISSRSAEKEDNSSKATASAKSAKEAPVAANNNSSNPSIIKNGLKLDLSFAHNNCPNHPHLLAVWVNMDSNKNGCFQCVAGNKVDDKWNTTSVKTVVGIQHWKTAAIKWRREVLTALKEKAELSLYYEEENVPLAAIAILKAGNRSAKFIKAAATKLVLQSGECINGSMAVVRYLASAVTELQLYTSNTLHIDALLQLVTKYTAANQIDELCKALDTHLQRAKTKYLSSNSLSLADVVAWGALKAAVKRGSTLPAALKALHAWLALCEQEQQCFKAALTAVESLNANASGANAADPNKCTSCGGAVDALSPLYSTSKAPMCGKCYCNGRVILQRFQPAEDLCVASAKASTAPKSALQQIQLLLQHEYSQFIDCPTSAKDLVCTNKAQEQLLEEWWQHYLSPNKDKIAAFIEANAALLSSFKPRIPTELRSLLWKRALSPDTPIPDLAAVPSAATHTAPQDSNKNSQKNAKNDNKKDNKKDNAKNANKKDDKKDNAKKDDKKENAKNANKKEDKKDNKKANQKEGKKEEAQSKGAKGKAEGKKTEDGKKGGAQNDAKKPSAAATAAPEVKESKPKRSAAELAKLLSYDADVLHYVLRVTSDFGISREEAEELWVDHMLPLKQKSAKQ